MVSALTDYLKVFEQLQWKDNMDHVVDEPLCKTFRVPLRRTVMCTVNEILMANTEH